VTGQADTCAPYCSAVPVTWRVDSAEPFAVVSLTDPYSIQDWRAAILPLLDNSLFRTYRAVLVDRRQAAPATTEFVNAITDFMTAHRAQIAERAAIVVANDTSYGMSRMTQLLADSRNPHLQVRVFRSREDAAAWLTGPQQPADRL
jgi:hypothetical protein